VDQAKTNVFIVKQAPENHVGNGRVLINFQRRDGAKRFEIVRVVAASGRQGFAAAVGHYDDPDIIMMDYDLRATLGVNVGETIPLEVTRCGVAGTLRWYLTVRDPIIRVPAVLGAISFFLGIISLLLTIPPLLGN